MEDRTLDEIVSEIIVDQVSGDPEVKSEVHLKLCEKYLGEGEQFLSEGDYVQASEKFWVAASQMVKSMAAKRGEELRSHRELHRFVAGLRRETGDPEISGLWLSASLLPQNFYEGWLAPETVEDGIKSVKRFIEKIKTTKAS